LIKVISWKNYLITKWKIILFSGIFGALLGFGYALIKKPVYTAQLSFALEDEKASGGLGGALGLASQFGIDLGGTGGGAFSGDNLMELMKSRSMIEKTLLTAVSINGKQQTLAEVYIDFNQLRAKWTDEPELTNIHFGINSNPMAFSLQQDSLLGIFYDKIIKDNLSVDKPDKKLSIISVSVVSKNQLFSKLFTEVLADQVSKFYIETKTRKSTQNINILQHQTDSVRRELNAAITGMASSVDDIPNANPGRSILRTPSQHRQVDAQANTAILTELVKNLEIAKVSLRKETPLIQIIDRPILPLKEKKVYKSISAFIGFISFICIFSIFLLIRKKISSLLN